MVSEERVKLYLQRPQEAIQAVLLRGQGPICTIQPQFDLWCAECLRRPSNISRSTRRQEQDILKDLYGRCS